MFSSVYTTGHDGLPLQSSSSYADYLRLQQSRVNEDRFNPKPQPLLDFRPAPNHDLIMRNAGVESWRSEHRQPSTSYNTNEPNWMNSSTSTSWKNTESFNNRPVTSGSFFNTVVPTPRFDPVPTRSTFDEPSFFGNQSSYTRSYSKSNPIVRNDRERHSSSRRTEVRNGRDKLGKRDSHGTSESSRRDDRRGSSPKRKREHTSSSSTTDKKFNSRNDRSEKRPEHSRNTESVYREGDSDEFGGEKPQIIVDAKFEDVHLFHLKDKPPTPEAEDVDYYHQYLAQTAELKAKVRGVPPSYNAPPMRSSWKSSSPKQYRDPVPSYSRAPQRGPPRERSNTTRFSHDSPGTSRVEEPPAGNDVVEEIDPTEFVEELSDLGDDWNEVVALLKDKPKQRSSRQSRDDSRESSVAKPGHVNNHSSNHRLIPRPQKNGLIPSPSFRPRNGPVSGQPSHKKIHDMPPQARIAPAVEDMTPRFFNTTRHPPMDPNPNMYSNANSNSWRNY